MVARAVKRYCVTVLSASSFRGRLKHIFKLLLNTTKQSRTEQRHTEPLEVKASVLISTQSHSTALLCNKHKQNTFWQLTPLLSSAFFQADQRVMTHSVSQSFTNVCCSPPLSLSLSFFFFAQSYFIVGTKIR